MVKILLNPSLQLLQGEDEVCLISEVDCYVFPPEYLPLLSTLQTPTDIDEIDPEYLALLAELGELRLLVNASLNDLSREVVSYWLAKGYHPAYARAQLDLSIEFAGPLAERYESAFTQRYPECPVVKSGGKLIAYVTDDLLNYAPPPASRTPIVLIKVGGMKQSIGPVLSPAFTIDDLQACIDRPFENNLSIPVPASVQSTADAILMSELYHLRVQAGNHRASSHVVEWNMGNLTKKFWKVKLL